MRRLLLAALLCLPTAPAAAGGEGWIEPNLALNRKDTAYHMSVSFVGTLATAEFLKWRGYPTWKANLMGAFLMTAAGAAKELAQSSNPSGNDFIANGVGVGAALGLQWTFKF